MKLAWRDLWALRPAAMPLRDTVRLVAPAVLALVAFAWAGRFVLGLVVALGAYIVLFGAGQPGRKRVKVYLTAAVGMLVAVSVGVLAAGSFALTLLAYAVIAVVAVAGDLALDLGPPGPYFFVLVTAAGATVLGGALPLGVLLPYMACGSALAMVFALADEWYAPHAVERRAIAAARDAVSAMRAHGAAGEAASLPAPGPAAQTVHDSPAIDPSLPAAADAMHRAWTTWLDGAGRDAASRPLERDLVQLQGDYRARLVDALLGGVAAKPQDLGDPRQTGIGPPRLAFRVRTALAWPSVTLITLLRILVALVVASTVTRVARDHHPFWATLVVLLVLMYPGTPASLTLRAVQRFLGTAAGIAAFAVLAIVHLPQAAYVALLCLLLFASSRVPARNYLYGTVFITLFALYLTVPLAPSETPQAIALDRLEDTVAAVAIALAAVRLVGPRFACALACVSAGRIARAASSVLDRFDAGQAFLDEAFVEDRRRLQYLLLRAHEATRRLADLHAEPDAGRCDALEQRAECLGYRVLAFAWALPDEAHARRQRIDMRAALDAVEHCSRPRARPAPPP